MKKFIIIFGVVVLLLSSGLIYINYHYFFNPLTFKQDDITSQSWNYYKNPLSMEISNIDKGWKTVNITNVDEIKFVFSELKQGQETERNYEQRKNHFAITIRELGTNGRDE